MPCITLSKSSATHLLTVEIETTLGSILAMYNSPLRHYVTGLGVETGDVTGLGVETGDVMGLDVETGDVTGLGVET